MDRRNLIIVAVAIVLGLVAVYLANAWFSGMEERFVSLSLRAISISVVLLPMTRCALPIGHENRCPPEQSPILTGS